MARDPAGGSIIYKILILGMIALLIYTLVDPKIEWDRIETEMWESRARMKNIYTAETKYISDKGTYNDTLQNVFSVISEKFTPAQIDSIFGGMAFDSLYNAPGTNEPYKVVVVDTSEVKHITIECPLGYGDIEDGELSWQKAEDNRNQIMKMKEGQIRRREEARRKRDSLRAIQD